MVSTDRRRGAEVFSERLRYGLEAKGWGVDLVSLTTDPGAARIDAHPLTARLPGQISRLDLSVATALRRRIRTTKPDVVLANGSATLRYSVVAVAGLGVPLAHRSIGEPAYWISSSRSALFTRALLRRLDLVLAVSHETRRQLLDLEPSIAARTVVAYNGVPEDLFEVVRARRGVELRMVVIGSLSEEKNPLAALRAAASVPRSVIRYLGDGALAAEVGKGAEDMGMADRVEMLGAVQDTASHLAWADLLVLSSRTEGLPGVVLEAAAAGVPTVAYAVGGVGEVIVDNESGRLVAAGDEPGLIDALGKLAADRPLLERMGEAARRQAGQRFRLEMAVDAYADHLGKLSRP